MPDVLLFGGVAVPHAAERPLCLAIEKVKAKYGMSDRVPVKWSFQSLKPVYEKHKCLGLYWKLLPASKDWRKDIFEVAASHDFAVIISCVGTGAKDKETLKKLRRNQAAMVFSNGLMRFALHVQEKKPTSASVILDWPDGNDSLPYDEEYAGAYCRGESIWKIKYTAGPLRNLGFTDSPLYGRMCHSTLLQFADLVVGATRDFVERALGKQDRDLGVQMLKIIKRRLRGAPNNILGRGIDVSTSNRSLRDSVNALIRAELSA